MIGTLSKIGIGLTLVLAAGAAPAQQVIDRIIATVNGNPILQSDLEDAIGYESFIEGKPPEALTAADRKATLERLIDQELLREQLASASPPAVKPDELKNRIEEVRKLYPGADTEDGWRETLARYGLTEKELEQRLTQQVELASFVDSRLRPGIQIDSASIEVYYRDNLLPQLEKSAEKPSLAQVTPQIKQVLTEKKMNDLLASWLQSLRSESTIHNDVESPSLTGGQNR
jgi:SurA N-terminal domain